MVVVERNRLLVDYNRSVLLPNRLLQCIVFLVELINIVEKLHILLLCLDKGRDDFGDVVDTGCLHDRFEGFLDDFGIANILVEQTLLFNVLVDDGVDADLQNFDRISVSFGTLALFSLRRAAETFVAEFDLLVFGL